MQAAVDKDYTKPKLKRPEAFAACPRGHVTKKPRKQKKPVLKQEPYFPKIERHALKFRRAAKRDVAVFLEQNPDVKRSRNELALEVVSERLALAEHCLNHEYDRVSYDRFTRDLGMTVVE